MSQPAPRRRTALLPAVIAVLALLVGLALLESDTYTVIRFIVSIFALIVAVFAWRARHWWRLGLAAIAVLWNPVMPIEVPLTELWFGMQYVAAIVFLAAGAFIREPAEPEPEHPARR